MNKNNELCYLAFEPKEEQMTLIRGINTLTGGQDVGYQAPIQQAIVYILKLNAEKNEEEVTRILKKASKTQVAVRPGIAVPRAIKVGVRKTELDTVENIFRQAFQIQRIQRPFFARVLLTAYFLYLREENKSLGVPEGPVSMDIVEEKADQDDALLRFRVSVEVADMLLRNAPEDKAYIHQILETVKRRWEVT